MASIFIFKVYSIYKDTLSLEEKFKRIEHVLNYIQEQLMYLENNFSFYNCIGINKLKIISDYDYIKFKEIHKKNFKNQYVKAILLAPEYFYH